MKIQVTNNDWHTKKIPVTDRTYELRYTHKKIPTCLAMERKLLKAVR